MMRGKRVLLTGASGGIGRHLALELARRGAALALVARDAARLDAVTNEARALGATAVSVPFDLASATGHQDIVDLAASALGGLDVLVNNAGIQRFGSLADEDPAAISRLVAINITAPLLLTRAAIRCFRGRGGEILNVGSTFGAIGFPHFTAYSASKFALRGMSEALRRELQDAGIRVRYISPRATDTDMNSAAVRELHAMTGTRVDDPESVARAVIAVLGGKRAEQQLGWPERFFVKLNALLPGAVDKALVQQGRIAAACLRRASAAR